MSAKTQDYLLTFRADANQAKGEVQGLQSSVVGLHQEAERLSKTSLQGGNLTGLGESAANTNQKLFQTTEAGAAARSGFAGLASSAPQAATALNSVENSVNGLTKSMAVQVNEMLDLQRSNAVWRNQLDDVRAQYDPIFATSRRYQQELEGIAEAEKLGALNATTAAQARERAAAILTPATANMKAFGTATKLTAWEQRNLMYQVNDTVQSIALGMPISQVALQQGPQILQIYGSVGNMFRAMTAVATPARLALGATAGAALLGVASYDKYLKSVKAVETAATGIGRRTAGSMAQMEEAAQFGANAAGISVQAARGMQVQFLQTGQIGSEHFEDLISISKDFAVTIGVTTEEAGSSLSQMFSDPAKAAETLNQKYGLIDGATARLAANLSAQNRQSEAQGVLLDALPNRLAKAETAMTGWQRMWSRIGPVAAGIGDEIGRAIDETISGSPPPTPEEMLGKTRFSDEHLNELLTSRYQRDRTEGIRLSAERSAYEHTIATRAALSEKEKASQEAEAKGNRAAAIADASPAIATDRRIGDLRNQIAALQAGQHPDNGLDDTQTARINDAIEAKTRLMTALESRRERGLELDRLDIAMSQARNPLLKADIAERKKRLELEAQEMALSERLIAADRVRQTVLAQAVATSDTQAIAMREEATTRNVLAGAVTAGLLPMARLEEQIQKELALRPLIEAAAAAEGAERATLTQTLREQDAAYDALLASKRASAALSHLAGGQDDIARLRLEQALIGQNSDMRARAIAQLEAERKIRDLGLNASSDMAHAIRRQAEEQAGLTAELRRQADAWGSIEAASGQAIDGTIDKLLDADVSGALQSVADELQDVIGDLAIKNPLRNMLLGQDLETLGDIGGAKGILDRLMGRDNPSEINASALAQHAASMAVTTPMVTIHTGAVSGPLGLLGGAGGGQASGFGGSDAASLNGSGDVQRQVWEFFAQKGLEPHQISAVLGNVSAESGFDPHAVGDGGTSFGLFQHHAGRGQGLLNHVGGADGLGNVQGQLEYVWKELLGSESGVLQRLLSSQNVTEATGAFVGFERPQGWSASNPTGALGWDERLRSAEAALTKFSGTTAEATLGLGTLGTGFGDIGQMLSQLQIGGGSGNGSILGSLLGTGLKALGIPGFRSGGKHLGGWRVVGEEGPELENTGPSTIVPANLTRQLLSSAGTPPAAPAQAPANPVIIQNFEGVRITEEKRSDGRGGQQTIIRVGEMTAAAASQPGNPLGKTLGNTYGLKRKGPKRS